MSLPHCGDEGRGRSTAHHRDGAAPDPAFPDSPTHTLGSPSAMNASLATVVRVQLPEAHRLDSQTSRLSRNPCGATHGYTGS
jgi:hypothetical protein